MKITPSHIACYTNFITTFFGLWFYIECQEKILYSSGRNRCASGYYLHNEHEIHIMEFQLQNKLTMA